MGACPKHCPPHAAGAAILAAPAALMGTAYAAIAVLAEAGLAVILVLSIACAAGTAVLARLLWTSRGTCWKPARVIDRPAIEAPARLAIEAPKAVLRGYEAEAAQDGALTGRVLPD